MPKTRFVCIISFFIFTFAASAFGIDDGFGDASELRTRHFTVYYSPQLDISRLAKKLKITFSDRLLSGTDSKAAATEGAPAEAFDTLFLGVCNLLDMNLYSFSGTIKICNSAGELKTIYDNLFDKPLADKRSFYVADLNTIYISAQYFDRRILGHEMAHAVISHFFTVPPPIKASEVLAGYVEYQLSRGGRK